MNERLETIPKETLEIDHFHEVSNIIFQLIDNKKMVLDVGCGTGRLDEKLKFEKNCFVVGIENDEARAKIAQNRLNKVIVADVEELNKLPFSSRYFDIIVFADVLEHLKNPSKVLNTFKEYLNDNGHILISVPNVANWTLRLKLLLGKWEYKERGLLDKTHLKFYTLKTAKKMIEECGFKIVHLTCTTGCSWIDRKTPLNSPANIWKSLLGCNFIFKARKSSLDSKS